MRFEIFDDPSYVGEGISAGLVRGLMVKHDGKNITREGMGIGSLALRKDGYTYFAGTSVTANNGRGAIQKKYYYDRRLVWTVFGMPSLFITRFSEGTTDIYMKNVILQKTIMNPSWLQAAKKMLRIGTIFEKTKPIARADAGFHVKGGRAKINFNLVSFEGPLERVYAMNELGAQHFNCAYAGGVESGLPAGWERIDKGQVPVLKNRESGDTFYCEGFKCDKSAGESYWGSEISADLCWAGFEYVMDLRGKQCGRVSFSYSAVLKEGTNG
jgi:hypothetical protein